ncbi:DUF1292 domain-containing protein [Psychrobacillus psychrodurans]|uniref:DUF1292 domain-containing protein n=1 Tax=Psychrobacillus TaxID=1221880 RepID=UPI000B893B5E|nr:DUF1292 domain-containing protein [Psychrobacillus psychrodurans]MCK1999183.1 DUF1292 domain-containing protein [Psychrobacillus psychrodurans]MCZ8541437.1 DUF1292 domain-containing protein [Psychrobacillus psychrodurans]
MGSIEVGEILTVLDEDDREQEIEVIGLLTIEDKEYAAVAFAEDTQEETDEDMDVFFFQVVEGEDLAEIETDEEFEKVSAAFLDAEEAVEDEE